MRRSHVLVLGVAVSEWYVQSGVVTNLFLVPISRLDQRRPPDPFQTVIVDDLRASLSYQWLEIRVS